VAEANSSDEMAGLLQISVRTVERHRENILEKLGMRDRVQLTHYAIRHGLVELWIQGGERSPSSWHARSAKLVAGHVAVQEAGHGASSVGSS
jgi:hypothetical protein